MDYRAAFALGIPIAVGLAGLGSAIGLGIAVGAALEGIARQPEALGKIRQNMFLGAALIEAITFIVMGFVFIILQRV